MLIAATMQAVTKLARSLLRAPRALLLAGALTLFALFAVHQIGRGSGFGALGITSGSFLWRGSNLTEKLTLVKCKPGQRFGDASVEDRLANGEDALLPLRRCSSATLLGGWENQTFVPLPADALAPFLKEARGELSRAERAFFIARKDGVEVAPPLLPFNSKSEDNEPIPFSPPCYYHFYTRHEIVQLFAGKWVYFLGDSHTRGMVLGLLSILDPEHRSPYSDERWFNSTKAAVNWPHLYNTEYFFREDGSILFKTAESRLIDPSEGPKSGYSFRLSYRFHRDVEFLTNGTLEIFGELEWAPDVLYFNSGSWDAAAFKDDPENWTLARFDRGYARLLDIIAEKCDPTRQVCFWGTIGHLPILNYDAFAVLQWRQMARIAAAQADAGNISTVHFLDRYWVTRGIPDQNYDSHMTLAVNVWLPQLLMNAYHSVAEERGFLAKPVSLAEPGIAYRKDEIRCVLLPGAVEKVTCEKYPLRVEFEKGCFVERDNDQPDVGETHVMWARNCTATVS